MSNVSAEMSKFFTLRWRLLAFNISFLDFKENNFIYEGWNFNSGNYLFTTDTK